MDNNSAGFASALGGSESIKQAMLRRGMTMGATQQVSPSAPTFNPASVTPPSGQASPMPRQTQVPGQPAGESQIIIKALTERLKSLGQMGQ